MSPMPSLTSYTIVIALLVAVGGFMVGFGIATYAVSIGQAGFYQCFHLDQAQEAKKLKLSGSCKWLRRMSSLF